MANSEQDRRESLRIDHHLVIRYRVIDPPYSSQGWDMATVRNISKAGILFYASHYYKPGNTLEIKLKNPFLQQDSGCWGKVVRCKPVGTSKDTFAVAVRITKLEESTEELFNKTIQFYLSRKKQK